MNIDWSKAPEWANAVVAASTGTLYFVEAFGVRSKRRAVSNSDDCSRAADMTIKSYSWKLIEERPKKQEAWNGEGLPPVGTVCYRINVSASTKVEIIAHFDCTADRVAAYIPIEGRILVDQAIASCFKPIKTKEEIEKEKYLSEILVISNIISMATGFAGPTVNNISRSIYEAGYRKQ